MYQRFIAIGRLGRDPQITTTAGGTKVATLNLATSEYVKGEERTEWHRVVIWDERLIETVERHVAKGTLIAIEGQVRTRKWQKDGQEVTVTEIVLDRFHSRLRILGRGRGEGEAAAAERVEGERVEGERDEPAVAAAGSEERAPVARRLAEFADEQPF